MTSRRDNEHFFRLPPPKNAKLKEITGNHCAKLAKSSGKISLNCDYCGLSYETYAAWAKRYTNHFCSSACRFAYQTKVVERICPICKKPFKVKAGGPATCSTACYEQGLVDRNERAYNLASIRWSKNKTDA